MGPVLLRVRSARAPYRRGGIEFGNLPLVLGREHFADGIDGLRQLVAIVTDPVLRVAVADADTPDKFEPVPDEMPAALVDALRAVEVAEDKSTLNEAIGMIVAGLIGEGETEDELAEPPEFDPELAGVGLLTGGGDFSADRREPVGDTKLQSPEDAEDDDDDAAAPSSEAGAKADGGTDAAPAVETPPASDAAAASGEQSRAGADASGAAPAADADAGKQPGDTQQPPVAATDSTEPSKEAPVQAKAPAKADAKPARSSGRQSGRAPAAKKTG